MAKLKNPLLSLGATGNVTKFITFLRRRKQDIAEKYPIPKDAKSPAQLAWRPMFLLAIDLWHALSPAEKQEWESDGTARHMTGYAWFISQALRPNPGLYLPLLGGTMQGNVDMSSHKIFTLPDPTAAGEPLRKGTRVTVAELPALTDEKIWKGTGGNPEEVDMPAAGAKITSGQYTGNDTVNRAIPHGLGVTPKFVSFQLHLQAEAQTITAAQPYILCTSHTGYAVTAPNATNFYVGNALQYEYSANADGFVYDWIAIG